jgi:hypothetical protein
MEHVLGGVCRLDLGEPPIGTVAVCFNSAAIIIRVEDVDVDAGTGRIRRNLLRQAAAFRLGAGALLTASVLTSEPAVAGLANQDNWRFCLYCENLVFGVRRWSRQLAKRLALPLAVRAIEKHC